MIFAVSGLDPLVFCPILWYNYALMAKNIDTFRVRSFIPLAGLEVLLFPAIKRFFPAAMIFTVILVIASGSFSEMTSGNFKIIENVVGSGGGNSSAETTLGQRLYSVSGQIVSGGSSEAPGYYFIWAGNIYTLGEPVSIAAANQFMLSAGFNLFSLPVIPADTSISSVIGNKLEGKSARIYAYSPVTGWTIAFDQDGTWGGSLTTIEPDKGYWIKVSSAATFEIEGSDSATSRTITLEGQKPNLIGTAYNTARTMAQTDLAAYLTSDDKIWGFSSTGWKPAYITGGSWGGALSSFEAGRGYWIIKNSAGEVDWVYPKP
jgi:hypothetical protein